MLTWLWFGISPIHPENNEGPVFFPLFWGVLFMRQTKFICVVLTLFVYANVFGSFY